MAFPFAFGDMDGIEQDPETFLPHHSTFVVVNSFEARRLALGTATCFLYALFFNYLPIVQDSVNLTAAIY